MFRRTSAIAAASVAALLFVGGPVASASASVASSHPASHSILAAPLARGNGGTSGGHVSGGGGRGGSSGGGRGTGGSGGSTRVGSGSGSNPGTGGRGVKPPSGSGGKVTGTGGRAVKVPSNSGGKSVPLGSKYVIVNPPTSKLSVSSSTRASGKTYSSGGSTWTYSRASYHSYYTTYHGGYPLYGSTDYWTLYDSPYYAPNYRLVGNPWYGHSYPAGYILSNGEFVPVNSGSSSAGMIVLYVFLGLIALAALVFGSMYLIGRRNGRTNYGSGF